MLTITGIQVLLAVAQKENINSECNIVSALHSRNEKPTTALLHFEVVEY